MFDSTFNYLLVVEHTTDTTVCLPRLVRPRLANSRSHWWSRAGVRSPALHLEMIISVSSTLDSAVWPYRVKLFVPGPTGDRERAAWAEARAWAWPDGSADGQGG